MDIHWDIKPVSKMPICNIIEFCVTFLLDVFLVIVLL